MAPLGSAMNLCYTIPMRPPDEILSGTYFYSPMVYGWRRDQEYLYIGSTDVIMKRFAVHHIIDKIERFLRTDKLDLWFFNNRVAANDFETKMIKEHLPKYNTTSIPAELIPRIDILPERYTTKANPKVIKKKKSLLEDLQEYHVDYDGIYRKLTPLEKSIIDKYKPDPEDN